MPANITLTFDPVATLNKLKTIYDSLNETEHDAIPNLKSDFLTWLDDTFGTSGLHRRSVSFVLCGGIIELTQTIIRHRRTLHLILNLSRL